jgi:hypothetical protein
VSEFISFDPLQTPYGGSEEAVIKSVKREIRNILNSYVGWYDPFCELIQNSLDAIDKRKEKETFIGEIHIIVNLQENTISVTDNGIGFKKSEYLKFLAPNFSFKSDGFRGHKGVGTTYLAYGFNYIQIFTKTPDFSAHGVMKDARNWLDDSAPSDNPKVVESIEPVKDSWFDEIDRGTSMTVQCDSESYPKDLSWMGLTDADGWLKVLRVQTGLGQINKISDVKVVLTVYDKTGKCTIEQVNSPTYLSVHEFLSKVQRVNDINAKMDELYKKNRFAPGYKLPSKFTNLDAVYDKWTCEELCQKLNLSEEELTLVKKYNVTVIFSYVYSLSVWDKIDESIGIRKGNHVLYGGIQLAANNMPQGELIQIPLSKNIGRQKQANIVVHFEKCSADLGRKGFKKEVTDLGKEIGRKLMDNPLMKVRTCFKANTGASPDLRRQTILSEWKKEMTLHEQQCPLVLENPNFFDPVKKISITSVPTREQDVIALFNQLIAGGVVRGIKIMSTNERTTYDSLYKIVISNNRELQLYDKVLNPLGVSEDVLEEMLIDRDEFVSDPQVLEYKFSIDGLIEDIESGIKNTSDINLVVAWEAGEHYKDNYIIESLLVDGNESLRQYHGITHKLHSANTSEYVCDMILLKDLVMYLNNSDGFEELQESYEV